MTLGELERWLESRKRVMKAESQERASFDYILADLIGKSVARIYGSSNKLPTIEEAYPTLFDTEELKEQRQEQIDNLSAARFRQFADRFNQRFKEEGEDAGNTENINHC